MFLAESSIQLVPDGTLLVHLLVIGIMVAVLNRTLLKPINRILKEREELLSGRMSEAAALSATREEKVHAYESALREARSEGYHMLEREKAEALRGREIQLNRVREELGRLVASENEGTRSQEEQARRELETKASELSELIGSQVLRRPLR
ncbi:MAG TPA: ATP synthase F0 subunit B [Pyrinomonadaceae bacterium]